MPFHDSTGNYAPAKGKGSTGAKSSQGANSPKAKPAHSVKQKQHAELPKGAQAMANSNGKKTLDKNLAGDNENSRMENTRQKTKYPGKGMQAKGSKSPKAKGRTSKADKQKNLDSGVLF